MKLNVGSGRNILIGYDNLDNHSEHGANIILDLNKLPLKIESNFYSKIIAIHVLEHLVYTSEVIDEFIRILKPRGQLIIEVPYGDYVWDTISHKRQFYITTFIDYPHQLDSNSKTKVKFINARFVNRQQSFWVRFKVSLFNFLIKMHIKTIDYTFLRFLSKGLFIKVKFIKI